ncbi:MAG: hypothetical protein AAF215_31500 [Cyanobacteria bacterium P01_A01_bin.123]
MINVSFETALQSHYRRLSRRPCDHAEREYAAELLALSTHNGQQLDDHELAWLRWFDVAYPPETVSPEVEGEGAIALTA